MLPDRKHDRPLQQGPYCGYHGGTRETANLRWIVIHDAEGSSAQGVANYGVTATSASWHVTVDDVVAIRCLADDIVAYHAYSPANEIGLGLEICGYAAWSKATWFRHQSTLKRAAWVTARWCVKYDIPVRWLTDQQLRNEACGLTYHAQITRVFRKGSHTDPGKGFPYGYFLYLVKRRVGWLKTG
jgi:N-acetylmuramoyl-L-alanine amidase CwlA